MNFGLLIQKVWFDDHLTELSITISNGSSKFTNKVYIAKDDIKDLIDQLDGFKNDYYGGLIDILWGGFGHEYANGAFAPRLHFPKPSTLYLTTYQQTEFFDFKGREEADQAKMYLKTEPVLLDNFIEELKALDANVSNTAELACVHKF